MRLLHRSRDGEHTDEGFHGDEEVHGAAEDPAIGADNTATMPAPAGPGTTAPAVSEAELKIRERTWTFAPGQLVSLAAGVFVIAVGLVALIRAGIDGSFDEPVVSVLGYDHTAWLGAIEVGVGALLILAGTGVAGRPLSVLLGVLMIIAGVLVLAEIDAMPDELGLEREFGWPVAVLGGVVALAALILPVWRTTTTTRDDTIDLRDRRFDRARPRTS